MINSDPSTTTTLDQPIPTDPAAQAAAAAYVRARLADPGDVLAALGLEGA